MKGYDHIPKLSQEYKLASLGQYYRKKRQWSRIPDWGTTVLNAGSLLHVFVLQAYSSESCLGTFEHEVVVCYSIV